MTEKCEKPTLFRKTVSISNNVDPDDRRVMMNKLRELRQLPKYSSFDTMFFLGDFDNMPALNKAMQSGDLASKHCSKNETGKNLCVARVKSLKQQPSYTFTGWECKEEK